MWAPSEIWQFMHLCMVAWTWSRALGYIHCARAELLAEVKSLGWKQSLEKILSRLLNSFKCRGAPLLVAEKWWNARKSFLHQKRSRSSCSRDELTAKSCLTLLLPPPQSAFGSAAHTKWLKHWKRTLLQILSRCSSRPSGPLSYSYKKWFAVTVSICMDYLFHIFNGTKIGTLQLRQWLRGPEAPKKKHFISKACCKYNSYLQYW